MNAQEANKKMIEARAVKSEKEFLTIINMINSNLIKGYVEVEDIERDTITKLEKEGYKVTYKPKLNQHFTKTDFKLNRSYLISWENLET